MRRLRLLSILSLVALSAAVGYRAAVPPVAPAGRGAVVPLVEVAPAPAREDVRDPAAVPPPISEEPDPPEAEELAEAERKNREAVERAAAGDTEAAIILLREAHALEPATALYKRNLQTALINAGFAAIASEAFGEAVARFAEGLKLGDRAEVRRGLGYAYYRLGEVDLARINLERALEQAEPDGETLVTLGRIYLEGRDQQRALAMFERAQAAGADPPGMADTIARLRRDAEAEAGYHALGSSHFVLKIEGREHTQAGRLVLNALEEAYRKIGARFAYYPLERLEVVLYPDTTFREITNSPHWSGGVYDGRIKIPVGGLERGSERLSRTLRHEYAHAAIVTLSRGKVPVWLNEGLAQVAEEVDGHGRMARLRAAAADGELLPLTALERGFTGLGREQASLAYAQSYFAARYLLEQKGGYNVRRLLEAMADQPDVDAAFRTTLSLGYDEFERRMRHALRREVG